jgi:hypothetical protein
MKSSKGVDALAKKNTGNAHIGRSGEMDKEEDEILDDVRDIRYDYSAYILLIHVPYVFLTFEAGPCH